MAIELQQHLRLQQSLVMTPQLQMAIKLLQLSRLELAEMIQQEIETNPTLEETPETYNEDSMEDSPDETIAIEAKEPDQLKEVSMDEKFDSYLDWNNDSDDFSGTGKMQFEGERKESPDFEAFITNKTSLADHLRWQLLMTRPSPEDEEIGSLIIGNIDKDGYLDMSVEELAQAIGGSSEKVSRMLALMKTFDPPGVFASDLKECLLLQAGHMGVDDPLIIDMIRYHLKDLETKRYKDIAKALKTVVVKGKSAKPVYLAIIDGKYELRDAAHLLGKKSGEVDDIIHAEVDPKAEILQHGMGAENGVLFSTLVSMSNRHNGRTGMGLVMASKNLKAVVVRGTKKVQLANQKALVELNRIGPKAIPENGDMDGLAKHGTAVVVLFNNTIGTLPTRNYNEGQFEGCEPISGERMTETVLKERDTCYACVVKCKRVVEIKDGPYQVDPRYGGAEYETLGTFGSYCGIDDLAAVNLANQICNEYAVDTIACGATIAFAMECYEKGIITKEQTGGLELKFGNVDAMLNALEQIVKNEGVLGKVLSQGSERAAKVWGNGADECLITVKGAESPAHMPQAKRSLALIYAVNPFGADHQSSEHDPYYEEGVGDFNLDRLKQIGLGSPQPAYSLTEEKVRFAYETEVFYSMLDSAELCQFVWGPTWTLYDGKDTANMVNSVTGWDMTVDELMEVGRRRLDLFRVFNAREGLGRKDDKLPKKFFKALTGTGPTAGFALTHEEVDSAIDAYYKLAGLNADGAPTPDTLKKHDIEWAAEYLPT